MKKVLDKLGRFLLPMLLGIIILSSLAYEYQRSAVVWLTAAVSVMTVCLFFLLDALCHMKRKLAGSICYILLMAAVVGVMLMLISSGYEKSRLPFSSWFYASVEDIPDYLYALIFGGGFLFVSALYYFTQVRYRGLFTMLLVLLPFAIYAKRLSIMPTRYLAGILLCYLLVMVHSRQTSADSGIAVIPDRSYIASVAAFAAAVTAVLFIIPLPTVESVQEKDSDFLDVRSPFQVGTTPETIDSVESSSRRHGQMPSGEKLFWVEYAENNLYLKTQSFSYFQNNDWHSGTDYYEEASNVWTAPETTVPGMAIDKKLEIYRQYCEYYGDVNTVKIIDEFLSGLEVEGCTVSTFGNRQFLTLTLPEGTLDVFRISPSPRKLFEDRDSHVYCSGEWTSRPAAESYELTFYNNRAVRDFAEELDLTTDDWTEVMSWYYERAKEGEEGFSIDLFKQVNSDRRMSQILYDGSYDEYSDELAELAAEITKDADSDYEKAKALEEYFTGAAYIYDLSYVPDDESIEYFVFQSKTGICTDFATAMTLMARSVGLTARYCEGYFAMERQSEDKNEEGELVSYVGILIVRDSYAHAFVEVYIPACGWVIFEPTVQSFMNDMYAVGRGSSLGSLFSGSGRWYIALGIIAAALLLAAVLAKPVGEIVFRVYVRSKGGAEGVRKMYGRLVRRLSKKTGTELSAFTVRQTADFAKSINIDISCLAESFDRSYYGGKEISIGDFNIAYVQYKAAVMSVRKCNQAQMSSPSKTADSVAD